VFESIHRTTFYCMITMSVSMMEMLSTYYFFAKKLSILSYKSRALGGGRIGGLKLSSFLKKKYKFYFRKYIIVVIIWYNYCICTFLTPMIFIYFYSINKNIFHLLNNICNINTSILIANRYYLIIDVSIF